MTRASVRFEPDRRTVLRAAGAAVALPCLPSLARAEAPDPEAAGRAVWVYVPNGVWLPDWMPEADPEHADAPLPTTLPASLAPLESVRAHVSCLRGLTHDKARANGDGPGDHARAAACFLTGVQPRKTEGQVRLARSADQHAAAVLGPRTRFPSLVLGTEPPRTSGQCDSGYACAYSSHVSWLSEDQPAPRVTSPRHAFDRLFGDPADRAARLECWSRRASVLDGLRDRVSRLSRAACPEDRQKLEQYLSAVRDLEARCASIGEDAALDGHAHERPDEPETYAERCDALLDLLVLALETDATRVATVMLGNEGSNRSFGELDVSEGHHSLSHHGGDSEKTRAVARIDRFLVGRFARFLERMAEARDADGRSVLQKTLVVYGSGIADGNRHDHGDLPILLAGGEHLGGRRLVHGRVRVFPDETPLNDLHWAVLAALGVRLERFGDGRGPLAY